MIQQRIGKNKTVKKEHLGENINCVGLVESQGKGEGKEAECGESSESSERDRGTGRGRSLYSRHMVSIDH